MLHDICLLPPLSNLPITNGLLATKFVRKMRGSSQPVLIECSDGKLYVVKYISELQGPNLLANEVIGSELLSTARLPTPRWTPVFISSFFIKKNPAMMLETASGLSIICEGWYFGSEFIGAHATGRSLEYLPSGYHERIINASDFLGIYIFDVLVNHCDCRQAIFTTETANNVVKASFIDNGHICGGPDWKQTSKAGQALCMDLRLYSFTWDEARIEEWIVRLETSLRPTLSTWSLQPPSAWYEGNINQLGEFLLVRLDQLRNLFWQEIFRQQRIHVSQRYDLSLPMLPKAT